MSGQLVIAELDAFRTVLGKVKRHEGETVKVWCRSTIANAVHRVGPRAPVKMAAEAAWAASDDLSRWLDDDAAADDAIDGARNRAMDALDALVAAVRMIKASEPGRV